jgi:hypothetical protein
MACSGCGNKNRAARPPPQAVRYYQPNPAPALRAQAPRPPNPYARFTPWRPRHR